MLIDYEALKKVIRKSCDKGHIKETMTHEQIVNNTIYNKAVQDVIDIIENINNGSLKVKELLKE